MHNWKIHWGILLVVGLGGGLWFLLVLSAKVAPIREQLGERFEVAALHNVLVANS